MQKLKKIKINTTCRATITRQGQQRQQYKRQATRHNDRDRYHRYR